MIHIKIRMLTARAVRSLTTLLASAFMLVAGLVHAQTGPQTLPAIKLGAGMMNIRVELADNPAARQVGLMHRKSMPTNDGMLFVFERAELSCFWMRNTLIPLSIAFLGDDGSIVNIADMKPLDETSHCPSRPVRLALEMNQGWFERHGLKAGDKLTVAPFGATR
jgi:uncharacterized membrane protein (UPF0127 family)